MTHYISPAPLTFETIDAILNKHYTLALSDESKQLINDCKAYLDHKIETSENPLYGITTGFGSLCKISISHDDLSQLQATMRFPSANPACSWQPLNASSTCSTTTSCP